MPNSLKLFIRTLLILLLMGAATWTLGALGNASSSASLKTVFDALVYFGIGLLAGSMVAPRFVKYKSKGIHLIPALVFLLVAITPLLSSIFPFAPLSALAAYVSSFSLVSFTLSGLFSALLFR